MNLKQLHYFKRLAEKQHYTEAAFSLNITQPSLSHAISELEKELGVTLFERHGRNVRITQSGQLFLPYVEGALLELENGRTALRKMCAPHDEVINLAFIYTMGEMVVPQLIDRFIHIPENTNKRFAFFQGTTLSIVQDLKEDKFDMALCSHIPDESDIEFIPVISQELVLVTSRDHPLAQRDDSEIDLEDAIAYPFIFFSQKSGLRQFIDKIFMQKKLIPEIACYVEEDTAMVGLVSINYGIAIMPRISTLSLSNVHVMRIRNPGQTRYVYLATHKDRTLSPAAESFKQFILSTCQSLALT
ncbi:LysR family transcriptional regulator [Dickeya zeae]|jgi:DNA-binding transcriptional LysR family regulator|uniref:LysR family transcriptional regulator n=1 Tax=Dickeya zeae TaxID=204042 RepID=A0ABX8VWP3_9GAMM|nr:LysR family transcriptional regulator [Dickeya zeae]PXW48807.1 DNA-binding transcriptional LysR family regulator [Erwinia sp. AG740]AUQ24315.1 LysR family transcriptional regulator [Dickeya zeae]MCA6988138.1 LysR family transcriptional regulator [Dickeya zeae]QYM92201.1 LysR family transcriptional regulator [Dickeya zeae]UJR53307.1 LysR family transcriptional regulator [Dickeya zeae MS1]